MTKIQKKIPCACGCGGLILKFRTNKQGRLTTIRRMMTGHARGGWTASQKEQLRTLYRTMPIGELSKILGHPIPGIYTMVKEMKITLGRDGRESISQAARRNGMVPKSLKLRLSRSGVDFGMKGPAARRQTYLMLDPKEVDRAVKEWPVAASRRSTPRAEATG